MDKTQTIIVALLVLSIVFSAVSIFTSATALNIEFPQSNVQHAQTVSAGNPNGNVELVVEGNPNSGGING